MARTVLEYVQACLNAMDSDNVDSIADVDESQQVADHLEEVYYELMEREDWPHLSQPINLTAAVDTSLPTKFTIDEDVRKVKWLRYNTATDASEFDGKTLCYLTPEEFVLRFDTGKDSADKQLVTIDSKVRVYVANNRMPEYWTSFDEDSTIYMDAFDSSIESTLTSDRLDGWGVVIPAFSVTDTFTPDVPKHMEQLLQAELNRQCFQHFKQQRSEVDEKKALRQLAQQRRRNSKVRRESDRYYTNNYGRRSVSRRWDVR